MPGFSYGFLKDWDGESPAPHDRNIMYQNHESSVEEDEVLRLTKQGVQLLYQQPLRTIQDASDKDLRKAWDDVRKARDRLCVIRIWKGIHQRRTKPHITARVVGGATLHIWLSHAGTGVATLPGFQYKVVAVSATERGGMVPSIAVVGVPRRGSVSYSVIENEKRRIAEEEEAERQEHIDGLMALKI
jgi:hypothetical protein